MPRRIRIVDGFQVVNGGDLDGVPETLTANGGDLSITGVSGKMYDAGDHANLEFYFEAIPQKTMRLVQGAGVHYFQTGSQIFKHTTEDIFVSDYVMGIDILQKRKEANRVECRSYDRSVAQVEQGDAPKVNYVSDGIAGIEVNCERVVHQYNLGFNQSGTELQTFDSFDYSSVAANVTGWVDSKIVGKNKFDHSPIYTTQDHGAVTYIRNPDCWAKDANLTCMSPWNSYYGVQMAGTLLTPRHIVFAAHFEIPEGSTVRFVNPDNTVVSRTMTHKRTHPNYVPGGFARDFTIGVLNADVPTTIKPAKVLPNTWKKYIYPDPKYIPALLVDGEENALIANCEKFETVEGRVHLVKPENTSPRIEFYEDLVIGDSGNPAFLIINGELVILTVFTLGMPGLSIGTSIQENRSELNAMIRDVDTLAGVYTGYELTEIDLSQFNTYN